jgi:hypothetical protein
MIQHAAVMTGNDLRNVPKTAIPCICRRSHFVIVLDFIPLRLYPSFKSTQAFLPTLLGFPEIV